MSEWVLIAVMVVVGCLILAAVAAKMRRGADAAMYQPAKGLFSIAERSFLGVLDQAVGGDHRVFGKVRVADVVSVRSGLSNSKRQGAFNRISAKHFDFIVCRTSDLSLVCVVELNDKSHLSSRAQRRDAFLADVCRNIHLPMLTVAAKRSYSLQDVRAQFLSAIEPPVENRVVA
jgi:Protein of unknown function (DUF2726)